ncbi:MAG: hypothetical protein J6S51_01280 [Kiritimatiellae bacterium]|nr:hypothetical protein [Kiritimatiellia bacterium]
MKTPADKNVKFTFVSILRNDSRLSWRAVLSFPQGATAETSLSFDVQNLDGNRVESGILEIFGLKLPVEKGQAVLNYSQFILGKHETPISLIRPNLPKVPGELTFQ